MTSLTFLFSFFFFPTFCCGWHVVEPDVNVCRTYPKSRMHINQSRYLPPYHLSLSLSLWLIILWEEDSLSLSLLVTGFSLKIETMDDFGLPTFGRANEIVFASFEAYSRTVKHPPEFSLCALVFSSLSLSRYVITGNWKHLLGSTTMDALFSSASWCTLRCAWVYGPMSLPTNKCQKTDLKWRHKLE